MNFKYDVCMYIQHNVDSFKVIWRKFRKRILESDNTIVFSIVNSLVFLDSRMTEMWNNKLLTCANL